MIGTIVNTCAIIVGTLAGAALGRGIKEKYKSALYNALGLASLMIGLNAAISNMPKSRYPVLFIVALAVGSAVYYSFEGWPAGDALAVGKPAVTLITWPLEVDAGTIIAFLFC